MRILQVNDYRDGGGCEAVVAHTITLLRDAGHEVRLFTADDVPGKPLTALKYISNRSAHRALVEAVHDFRPDVVHVHNFYHVLSPGILAALDRLRRGARPEMTFRIVMTAHDYHLICPNSGLNRFVSGQLVPVQPDTITGVPSLLMKRWDHRSRAHSMLKLAQHVWNYRVHNRREILDVIACPSRFMMQTLESVRVPKRFVPNPFACSPTLIPKPDGPLRYVFVGRLEPEKGVADFLFFLPDDFVDHVTVIGDGNELAECERIVAEKKLGDRVQFAGRLSHEQTQQQIAESHVLVLPSPCLENAPLVLNEALAVGTNILVANHGGMRETVESAGVGFAYDITDPASLAGALRAVHEAHAAETLNRFDVSHYFEQRSEAAYVENLMKLYEADACES